MSLLRMAGCLALAMLVHQSMPASGADGAAAAAPGLGLAIFVLIGGLWITQALPLAVTALLVPLLAVVSGLADLRAALTPLAHPIIFLFLGGFALAAALQQQGLDRALALWVLRRARGHRGMSIGLLFLLSAALSMWISNTAAAALMLPLALGMLRAGTEDGTPGNTPGSPAPERNARPSAEQAFVLLGIAYSASIGGMATLVGSPPNAIAAAQAGISFAQWLAIGAPIALVLLPMMAAVLYAVLRPDLGGFVAVPDERLAWTWQRRATLAIFAATAAGWVAGAPLAHSLGIRGDVDSLVALAAIVMLVASGSVRWEQVERTTQWSVLLLFGGGLALGQVMDGSGASLFLARAVVTALDGAPFWVLLVGVVAFVVLLTELVSNTASAALLVPIFLGVAQALGAPPAALAAAIALAASCAFMLPVATPPNALVFGTGQVAQATMMRCGFWLNLVCTAVIAVAVGFAWR
jgi:sodium-dependent dicarboxylate transporter 2/3/5